MASFADLAGGRASGGRQSTAVGVGRGSVSGPQKRAGREFRTTCLELRDETGRVREEGWFTLYTKPAKGVRSMQEFEEAVLRRFDMLSVLHQEEGLERLKEDELLKEITDASKGQKTMKLRGVFEWVPPVVMESALLTEELELRYMHRITPAMVEKYGRQSAESKYAQGNETWQEYAAEWSEKETEVVTDLYVRAFEDDSIAHWACRLACCGEEKWREWFMKHETTLFKGRFLALSTADQQWLLSKHTGLTECDVGALPESTREMLFEMETRFSKEKRRQGVDEVLREVLRDPKHPAFYEIDFALVPGLVRTRNVVVKGGKAIITHRHALNVLCDVYKKVLENGLMDALRARPDVEAKERDRVSAFLQKAVQQSMRVLDRSGRKQRDEEDVGLDIEDIAEHAHQHFPLCMRDMDTALRKDHHLKFNGRFQYGLFLKAAGLSLDNAMKFFGQTMTLQTTPAKFAKSEYGYSVRYWYGKEGKKTNFNALNCSTIIMGAAPSAGQCHGCPFKHYSESKLKALLKEPRPAPRVQTQGKQGAIPHAMIQLKESAVTEITKKCAGGHYSAACREYFVQTHPGYAKDAQLFVSPNHFHKTSVEFSAAKREATPAAPQQQRPVAFGQ
eukprot:TRINITY_DN16458_c0_g1_i1.p1 TRINITY_DN16458_c0_g1~~TRINITY_DN16458_c0_g1_i1.p1  ORF type:complete len:644 (+),score=189.95 TRINITY_DN16458_c0_g1_i1:77-1933(+)